MEWLTDPTVWLGLTTLVLLEIVLGIDNLIFIAILASKLPPDRQNSARQLGLGLALLLRLALLAGVFWLTTLTTPLFVAFGHRFSGRDLILLAGGLFLLLKATVEIHERLENQAIDHSGEVAHTSFAAAVAQIVLLDAIFSVDSILTAVGMTDMLAVMMAAVIVAMAIMFVASRPLMEFVSAHPPLVILCLGFLLMVGFSLVAEGVGFHIPKGYLYAAIGFSVVIEMFNQIGAHNRKRWSARIPRRQRVAQTVLRLLGGVPANAKDVGDPNVDLLIGDDSEEEVFAPSEKEMIRGVLALADRPVSSIMTPRPAVLWIDLDDTQENILSDIRNSPHAQLLVSRGSIDEIVGIVRKQDLLDLNIENKALDVRAVTRAPVVVYEATSILKTLELFKLTPVHMAVVVDEYGSPVGVVTQTDLLEAIAGDLPDPQGQQHPDCVRRQDGSLIIDASISIYDAVELLGLKDLPPGDYQTLAGFVLLQAGKIPQANDHFNFGGWRFEILEMEGPRITKLLATPEDHRNRT